MSLMFWKINKFFLKRSYVGQVVLFYLLTYLLPLLLYPLQLLIDKADRSVNAGPGNPSFIVAVLFAPLIETLLFQFSIFKIFQRKNLRCPKCLGYIVVSSLLFGLSHFYSFGYIVFAIAEGILLAYSFYFYHRNLSKAFWTTALVHSLHNATLFLLLYFKLIN
jgi:Type II CAAX prenyl endopeptidase Rce1-like